jgi:hypothetical protein
MYKDESFAEIRARKDREFGCSQILGSPTNESKERSVWPWWMVRIEELKEDLSVKTELLEHYRNDFRASFNRCRDLLHDNALLLQRVVKLERQIQQSETH